MYDLESADLKKLNPLYYKKEKGKVIDGSTPTLYPKLNWVKGGKDKKREKIEMRKCIYCIMKKVSRMNVDVQNK